MVGLKYSWTWWGRGVALALVVAAGPGCATDDEFVAISLPDGVTQWTPVGPRTVGNYAYDVIPQPDTFHTMHVGPNNTDNVWVAVAPELELEWVVEQSFFNPEGPTFDDVGNLYFSPLFPQENVSLVSLDAETGERNWAIEGNEDNNNAGSGAILILNDPNSPGDQIIYHATYTEAMALRPDGTELWRRPTGLELPDIVEGERDAIHSFGFNYHPQTDSVVVVMMGGEILAFDRSTGDQVAPRGQIPGAPGVSEPVGLPQGVIDAADALTDEVFGTTPSGISFFSLLVDVIFGGGSVVTNYFSVDPNTGRIFVAATSDDAADGNEDGLSELGALYALELVDDGSGGLQFEIVGSIDFVGGTGSTPTVSEDGRRVFVADNVGNVLALDRDLQELWRYDLGSPAAASIGVSPDNAELYAVTRTDVIKLIDEGDQATLDWVATLDAFADDPEIDIEFQALTPTLTANGVAISVGGGFPVGEVEAMLKVGVGLLDRETGRLRSFTLGREESIAVTSVATDGSIYTASSPVRRAAGRAIDTNGVALDVIGGISRYRPIRNDLLARDALCAAGARAQNAGTLSETELASAEQDIRQVRVLIEQSRGALALAAADGDLNEDVAEAFGALLVAIDDGLSVSTLRATGNSLITLCRDLDPPEPAP